MMYCSFSEYSTKCICGGGGGGGGGTTNQTLRECLRKQTFYIGKIFCVFKIK